MEKLVRLVNYNLTTTTAAKKKGRQLALEIVQVITCFIYESEWIRSRCMCVRNVEQHSQS